MRRVTTCFLGLVAAAAIASWVYAEVPQLINYQGILTDLSGTPIDGTHDLTFRIYTDATDPTALWTEVHSGVLINGGLFSEILGSITPFPADLFANGERWVGVTVDFDLEIAPRKRLISVPWALKAALADSCLSGAGSAGDGHSLDASDGDPVDAVYVNEEGKVGIGLTNPIRPLEVAGSILARDHTGGPGAVLMMADQGGGRLWSNDNYDPGDPNVGWSWGLTWKAGRVGIGTIAPHRMLHVNGCARLEPLDDFPANPAPGDMCVKWVLIPDPGIGGGEDYYYSFLHVYVGKKNTLGQPVGGYWQRLD